VTVRARSLVLALVLLFGGARAAADPAPIPEPKAPDGLPVVIQVGSSELDGAGIEGALRRELGVPLSFDPLAKERLEIVITGRRAHVTYYRLDGEPVTRSVDLPRDDQRAFETVAFLAGNLARDEAAELLKQLAPPEEDATEPPPPAPPPEAAPAPPPKDEKAKPPRARKPGELVEPNPFAWNISVWFPGVTLLADTEKRRMSLELGVAYSRIGGLRGAAFSLGYLGIDEPSEGYAFGLFWNRAGPFTGVQSSLFVNEGRGALTGIDAAGLVSFRAGDSFGAQGAGLYVQSHAVAGAQGAGLVASAQSLRGFQLGGVGSYSAGDVTGVQLSGTTAIARGDLEGMQVSGLFGYTRDLRGAAVDGLVGVSRDVTGLELAGLSSVGRDVRGAQLSGLFNLARDLRGLQLGTVNVARRVKGLQLGVVNVASEVDGGAIGVVNVSKNGKIQPTVWYSGPGTWLNAGVKFVTGYTYTKLGAGWDGGGDHVRYQGNAGLHLPIARGYVETGPGVAKVHLAKDLWPTTREEARYEAFVGWEVVRYVTPFAGGGVSYRLSGEGTKLLGEYFVGVSIL
jgi:hypothetical protein